MILHADQTFHFHVLTILSHLNPVLETEPPRAVESVGGKCKGHGWQQSLALPRLNGCRFCSPSVSTSHVTDVVLAKESGIAVDQSTETFNWHPTGAALPVYVLKASKLAVTARE
jgi:hypothetical protein